MPAVYFWTKEYANLDEETWAFEEEGEYLISGTIKKLDTYRGNKQTILTRCKVEEINS